jgi:hypothetical protein
VPVAQLTVHIAGRGLVVRHLRLPAAGRDSRFAVPCPSDRNARLDEPFGQGRAGSPKSASQHVPNVTNHVEKKKIECYKIA